MNDDDVAVNEWRAKLDEHLGSGGCMEAAQAASEERERENTETRRGAVRKVGMAIGTVMGLGVASETTKASPSWPVTPMSTSAYCTGEVDPECIAAVASGTGGCYACVCSNRRIRPVYPVRPRSLARGLWPPMTVATVANGFVPVIHNERYKRCLSG